MEVGSGSSSNSSSSSSSGSPNSLKFGNKNNFKDAGMSTAVAASRRPPLAPAKKGKGGVVQVGQPPRCQVEGCEVDLRSAKAYYCRHKVCGMHSKSPKVIVGGVEQRFCQQCSRFHLLLEFDQGKRSCRRRLAGHNERRRKPPLGPLFGRYGSSSLFLAEGTSKAGSFMLDFSTHTVLTGSDSGPNPETIMEMFPQHPWQRNSEITSTEILIQRSTTRTGYYGSDIPSGECLTGVSNSSGALSLLSSQPWDSKDQSSSLGISGIINANGVPMVQLSGSPNVTVNGFSSTSWGVKVNEGGSSSEQMSTDLAPIQSPQPASTLYYGYLDVAKQNGRQYLGLEHSIEYDSSLPNMLL